MRSFQSHLETAGLFPLCARSIDTVQINVGKLCNQTCKHCHVDAGPTRKEIMTWETMQDCLRAIEPLELSAVDITGGAPELNPNFRPLVEAVRAQGKRVIVRCNLTALVSNPAFLDLPDFFAQHQVGIIASLPSYESSLTDRQRGAGVFERSIQAMRLLNAVGYGKPDTGLVLDLTHNPVGAFLPTAQEDLESDFRRALRENHGVAFNRLYCITNMPISRYKDYLVESGNFEAYMDRLALNFNAAAAENVMCRNMISVGWDGTLYDCDFNQMLSLVVETKASRHIRDFDPGALIHRSIVTAPHCFGCTAGKGSSCGGEVTKVAR